MLPRLSIVLVLIKFVFTQKPSLCPEIFSYGPKVEDNKWYGSVRLAAPKNASKVQLSVFFDKPVDKFVVLEKTSTRVVPSSDNKVFVIKDFQSAVQFFVEYKPEGVPSVEIIKLDGTTICGKEKSRTVVYVRTNHTSAEPKVITSTLLPTTVLSDRNISFGSNYSLSTTSSPILQTNSITTTKDPTPELPAEDTDDYDYYLGDFTRHPTTTPKQSIDKPSCGTIVPSVNPLILHGEDTSPGQWPWQAALYHARVTASEKSVVYICAGTLVTEQHVIVPAHCVSAKRTPRPNTFLVSLGKSNLNRHEPEVQDRSLSDIVIYPGYEPTVYSNDIAVLKLSTPVVVTNFVRPCCLWEGPILDEEGVVVGWDDESKKLVQAKMTVVPGENCLNKQSMSNYCAGFKNGTSACKGKSIGGMVFPRDGSNTIWQIRGILSGKLHCDTSRYITFTDVAAYTGWIQEVIKEH